MRAAAVVAALAAATAAAADELPAGSYRLDPAHAALLFAIDHLGFSSYRAGFDRFDATLEIDPVRPGEARVRAEIDLASIDLPNPPEGFRDLLPSEAWFDADRHPTLIFESETVRLLDGDAAEVAGTATFRGVSAPVSFRATFNGGWAGHALDPNARIGFSAAGALSRSAFGMSEGAPPPGSEMGVGDLVRFEIEAELIGPPWRE